MFNAIGTPTALYSLAAAALNKARRQRLASTRHAVLRKMVGLELGRGSASNQPKDKGSDEFTQRAMLHMPPNPLCKRSTTCMVAVVNATGDATAGGVGWLVSWRQPRTVADAATTAAARGEDMQQGTTKDLATIVNSTHATRTRRSVERPTQQHRTCITTQTAGDELVQPHCTITSRTAEQYTQ